MKRFALITLFCSLASVLMCADIFAQVERQDDRDDVRPNSDRWMTEGRHKRIPNAQQIKLYRRSAEQGQDEATYSRSGRNDRTLPAAAG